MSSGSNNQTNPNEGSEDFPVAAIVILAVGAYVILVVVILIVRHKLVSRNACKSDCCGSGGGGCCDNCCVSISQSCPCCCSTSADGCLSKLCGKRKRTNCIDIFLCNCCGCTEGCCECCRCPSCLPEGPLCTGCSLGKCCDCSPSCPSCCADFSSNFEAHSCGCLCLEVKIRGGKRSSSAPPQINDLKQYSTHTPPSKHLSGSCGDISLQLSGPGNDNNTALTNGILGGDMELRQRSTSESRRILPSRNQTRPQDQTNNAFVHASGSSSNRSTDSQFLGKNRVTLNTSSKSNKSRDSAVLQSDVHSPQQLSRSLSDEFSNKSNLSGRPLLNSYSSNYGDNKKSVSRSRRSVRAGQMSQRFPNKVLVSAESVRQDQNLKKSSENSTRQQQPRKISRSMPQPNISS